MTSGQHRAYERLARIHELLNATRAKTVAKRQASRGKLPAYGKSLLRLRQRGLVPTAPLSKHPSNVYVCLDCWDWVRNRARVVVGYDQDAGGLDYSCLAGLDLILAYNSWQTHPDRRDELIRALVRTEPTRLYVMDAEHRPGRSFWVISKVMGLELAKYGELEQAA